MIKTSNDSSGFCRLSDERVILSMDYFTSENFIGRPIKGYEDKVCIMTKQAAEQIVKAQDFLDKACPGLRLKIFDAYRPLQAVKDFKAWSEDESCYKMKTKYYPDLTKHEIIEHGYIADETSMHTRGSAVDLTLCEQVDDQWVELDMGTCFDFFSSKSHTEHDHITSEQKQNRALLCGLMASHGFENYPLEWWHFSLVNEPFPDTYFDFAVTKDII